MSLTLSMNCGSGDSLKSSTRCGLRPNAPPDAADRRLAHPGRPCHRERVDQWVASVGVSSRDLTITRSTSSSVIARGLPGRSSSWRPSRPRSAKRLRHFPTLSGGISAGPRCLCWTHRRPRRAGSGTAALMLARSCAGAPTARVSRAPRRRAPPVMSVALVVPSLPPLVVHKRRRREIRD